MAEPVGIPLNQSPAPRPSPPVPPEMRRAAEEFESMVIGQLLQPMFEALKTDGLGGGGFGEEIFRPMLVEQYAHSIARGGGVGIAQDIIQELQRMQARAQASAEAQAAPPEAENGAHR